MSGIATPTPLRVGQKGHTFRARILDDIDDSPVDVSGASTLEVHLKAPDGTITTHTATVVGDGTGGRIEWKDTDGVGATSVGTWRFWGVAAWANGDRFISTVVRYFVENVGV